MALSTADRAAALARTRLFRNMSEKEIAELTAIARERDVAQGETIFEKSSAGAELYVIAAGRVRIDAPSREGRELTLRTLGAGEVFGEIAVFDRRPRTATARALVDSLLLVLDDRDLRAFLERRPSAAIKLLEVFASRLRSTTDQLEDSVFLTIEDRLAKALLALAKPTVADPNRCVTPPVTVVQLAQLIGTVRERVSKQLAAWEREGAIRRNERRIEIVDPARIASRHASRD